LPIICIFFLVYLSSSQGTSKDKLREAAATVAVAIGAEERREDRSVTSTNRGAATRYRELTPAA